VSQSAELTRATYRDLFCRNEFRALFTADAVSLLGDQVAAVALAVLLYQSSGSALVAALGYATAYLPWAVGGPLLSVLADRLPPRRVVVTCDLLRVVLIGLAAVPGLPLLGVGLLVLAAGLIAPPFDSAISALYPQALEGHLYTLGVSARSVLHQSAQLLGFLSGGALLVLIGPHAALGLDAATFALSALVLRAGLTERPAAMDGAGPAHLLRDALEGLRIVTADRQCYAPLLLGVLGSAYIMAPEAIAPAYAHSFGAGAATVGVIMASIAAGSIIGDVLFARTMSPQTRQRLMWPLAVIGAVPLLAMALHPPLPLGIGLLVVAGLGSAFQVPANTAFAQAVPAQARGRAFGIAMTGMFGGQGLAIIAAGAAAQVLEPSTVIAGAGALGVAAITLVWLIAARPYTRCAALHPEYGLQAPDSRH